MLMRLLVNRIYVELADQYKAMDAASEMGKRNLLANHLREVIDVLEQKVSFSRFFLYIGDANVMYF
jgi:Centrosome microtubule-binding domain of Cep57